MAGKNVSAEVDPKSVYGDHEELTTPEPTPLTPRQRTKLEKRDAAVAEVAPDAEVCDNHPDRPAVESDDGNGAHSMQHRCQECVLRLGR